MYIISNSCATFVGRLSPSICDVTFDVLGCSTHLSHHDARVPSPPPHPHGGVIRVDHGVRDRRALCARIRVVENMRRSRHHSPSLSRFGIRWPKTPSMKNKGDEKHKRREGRPCENEGDPLSLFWRRMLCVRMRRRKRSFSYYYAQNGAVEAGERAESATLTRTHPREYRFKPHSRSVVVRRNKN